MTTDTDRLEYLSILPKDAYLMVDKTIADRLSGRQVDTYLGKFQVNARDLGNGQFKVHLREAV